jgi:deazaflavin-dependent oxidoreductase (nitroreductase family)
MSVDITPRGTRGGGMPRFLRPLLGLGSRMMVGRYRRRHGEMSLNGQPLVLLTTVGAKSGERRETLVNRFPDGDSTTSWIITASAGGSATHPAWLFNLAKHPDQVWLEIDGRPVHVRPETLQGGERETAWQRIVSLSPRFGSYPSKTDRVIPVVRLIAIA